MSTGVIVGRFQVDALHSGHQDLINRVYKKYPRTIIALGCTRISPTKRNPLDFVTRSKMIMLEYPDAVVIPVFDNPSNKAWSEDLDKRIREVAPYGEVFMYGGRQSFIPSYKGRFKTVEMDVESSCSGTEIRERIAGCPRPSEDFRAGVIYANYNRYPACYPTVDIAIVKENKEILLGKKPGEELWRFPGGFVGPLETFEEAARREAIEECGDISIDDFTYICSMPINDNRYAKEDDKITTTFFRADFQFGRVEASDDLDEVKWYKLNSLTEGVFVPGHIELWREYKLKYKLRSFE